MCRQLLSSRTTFPHFRPAVTVKLDLDIRKTLTSATRTFTLEAAQKPLRSADDLLQASGIPVLAVLPPSQSTRAQRLIGGTGPTVTPPNLRLGN